MKRTTTDSIVRRLFGTASEAAIEALAGSPQVQGLLADIDSGQVARRKALLAELEQLPQVHESRCIEASAEEHQAKVALQKAIDAVNSAAERHAEAVRRAMSASLSYGNAKGRLLRELQETADPRIQRFIDACKVLFNQVRVMSADMAIDEIGPTTSKVRLDCTRADHAINALGLARERAEALMMQALSRSEITAALEHISADLLLPLDAVSKRPPSLSEDEPAIVFH